MMQPQAGIAALPQAQQPQMPGQAPGIQQVLPQMKPQAGGPMSAPQSFVSPLTQQAMPQLLQEFNNPQSQYPKFAVLAAMKERQEKERMQQAMQGQAAMGQAQQQQGSVADEIVAQAAQQPPFVMAAQGGIMQGYADGGPVAFAGGSGPFGLPGIPGTMLDEFKTTGRDPSEIEAQQKLQQLRQAEAAVTAQLQQFGNRQRMTAPEQFQALQEAKRKIAEQREMAEGIAEASKWRAQQSWEQSLGEVPSAQAGALPPAVARAQRGEAPVPTPETPYGNEGLRKPVAFPGMPPPAPPAPPAPPVPPRRALSGAPAAATGLPALVPPASTELSPEMRQAYENRMSALRTQQGVPEDILAGRAGLTSLMQRTLAEQQAEAKALGETAKAREGRPASARELFALAAGIDTRKGKGVGSLAGTAAGLLGARETAAETARKEQRGLQANIRQTQILEAQRQQAVLEKDFDRANQIQSQIDALAIEREKFGMERGDTAFTQDVARRKLGLEEKSLAVQKAAAYRPTAQEFMYGLYKKGELPGYLAAQQEPKTEGALLRDVVAAAMKNPLMLTMYPPEIQDLIKQEMLKLRLTPSVPPNVPVRE